MLSNIKSEDIKSNVTLEDIDDPQEYFTNGNIKDLLR